MILEFVDEDDDIIDTIKQRSDGSFYVEYDGWDDYWYDEPGWSNHITIDIESNPCMEIALHSEFIVNRGR